MRVRLPLHSAPHLPGAREGGDPHPGSFTIKSQWPQLDLLLTIVSSPPGYSLVTHIPAGARDIQIVERKKSADVLGTYVRPGQLVVLQARSKMCGCRRDT